MCVCVRERVCARVCVPSGAEAFVQLVTAKPQLGATLPLVLLPSVLPRHPSPPVFIHFTIYFNHVYRKNNK